MISVESSAIIERSVQDVWAFVADPRNEPQWHTDVLDIKPEADSSSIPESTWTRGVLG